MGRERGGFDEALEVRRLAQVSGYDFSTPEKTTPLDRAYAASASLARDPALILQAVLRRSEDNADVRLRE